MTEPLRIVFAGTPEFAADQLKALLKRVLVPGQLRQAQCESVGRHDRAPRNLQEVRDQGLDVLQRALFRRQRGGGTGGGALCMGAGPASREEERAAESAQGRRRRAGGEMGGGAVRRGDGRRRREAGGEGRAAVKERSRSTGPFSAEMMTNARASTRKAQAR